MDKDPEYSDFKEVSEEEIKNLLKEALSFNLKEKQKVPTRNQLNSALVSTLCEFLTCFKLIGYDLGGDPINMTVYREKMEKSALDNAFIEEMSRFMATRMGN